MRAYGNILFSFYCSDLFFKKGLFELLDNVYNASSSEYDRQNVKYTVGSDDYYWVDIVVLSSKSIFEELPKRNKEFGDGDSDGNSVGVIVFCTENMMNVIKGVNGYENAFFFTEKLSLLNVNEVFRSIIFGGGESRKRIFEKIHFDRLTNRERLVSELILKGKSQKQISNLTGINVKTVSSHLRSAMIKYHVNSVLEYIMKLSYIEDVNYI